MYYVEGDDISFESSPVDPLIVVFGEVRETYGMALLKHAGGKELINVGRVCLTHQIVSRVAFAPTGRHIVAAAMSAGHIFIYELSEDYKLNLVRYAEIGRGLADCFLMQVGEFMRAFCLVLFSDKYCIGERIACINAITGKDNKLTGKMQGPYSKLLPLSTPDTLLAIPHLSRQYHILGASTEKGGSGTVTVKIVSIIETGHDVRHFGGCATSTALITFGFDGCVILRQPHAPAEYDIKLIASHRYGWGFKQALVDGNSKYIMTLSQHKMLVIHYLNDRLPEIREDVRHEAVDPEIFETTHEIYILNNEDKTYLELQEEKKVREEAMDYKSQRTEIWKTFDQIQTKLVDLLEKNLTEIPLHQLPLSEFNLHSEAKKERLKQVKIAGEAEKEREDIRLKIEARIRAQDKVTAWIKKNCWDTMLSPRVKLFAIFSHYKRIQSRDPGRYLVPKIPGLYLAYPGIFEIAKNTSSLRSVVRCACALTLPR
ncbi:hypothetical protein EVAR_46277_1 [Eumeta japonica]|uniref:Cilia- and flagella-associated protein 43 n=1 Tax=Eumeta variegata TaxID=151549 RepID=A0A4C1Y6H9_EUMVA|nr:hypothetical protein EVAR_46277_1 [Eumeta japonica]